MKILQQNSNHQNMISKAEKTEGQRKINNKQEKENMPSRADRPDKENNSICSNVKPTPSHSNTLSKPKGPLKDTTQINDIHDLQIAIHHLSLSDLQKTEDQKVQQSYGPQILSFYQNKQKPPSPFLSNHLVTPDLRCKMIDWMIEVLSSYKCSETSFFIALETLDLYLSKETNSLENKDIHLIGVTCMFIASKYEEVQPISIKTFHNKISHQRFSPQEIRHQESTILSVLDYSICKFSVYEVVLLILGQYSCLSQPDQLQGLRQLQQVCLYLSKMVYFDYHLITTTTRVTLACGLVFVALKIVEQVNKSISLEILTNQLIDFVHIKDTDLYSSATNVLSLAKEFDILHADLENLKKFNGFSFEQSQ